MVIKIKINGGKTKTFSHYLLLILFLVLLQGCYFNTSNNSNYNSDKIPEWVYNPSKNGVVGGVGYCAAHVNGITGQRELATKRAIEEIARQKGVYVDSVMVISSKASNHTKLPDTKSNTISSFHSKNQVKAYIKEIWVHPTTKVMYVYMIAE